MKPILSIVTVVYNNASQIEKTIQSVINQTFERIEYIIIDGQSTDGTLEIVEKYKNYIIIKSEPDDGLYDAMNKGMQIANGEYLLFLNSGDFLSDPEIITHYFKRHNNEDIIYGDVNLLGKTGNMIGTRSELSTRKLPKNLNWGHMGYGMVVCHQGFIARRRLCPTYNLRYKCSADIDWIISILKNTSSTRYVNRSLSDYSIGGLSIKYQKVCLKERFHIYLRHYGVLLATYFQIVILIRAILHKLRRGKFEY